MLEKRPDKESSLWIYMKQDFNLQYEYNLIAYSRDLSITASPVMSYFYQEATVSLLNEPLTIINTRQANTVKYKHHCCETMPH